MPHLLSRAALPWVVCASLAAGCGPQAEGECQGILAGRSVSWPITRDESWHSRTVSTLEGTQHTWIYLTYSPEGVQGDFESFGVDIRLVGGTLIEAREGPRTAKLTNVNDLLVPEDESLVLEWTGKVGTSSGSGPGYFVPPGPPLKGSLTLDEVTHDHAAGRFTYGYQDGSELTCTFDVPNGAASGGGDGDDDDDDDD